ncbi:hypothetical protein F5888DRAFT_1635842 [Russula emetica]|nr:hypothetical protein F5888DRAFT_1635842 [Russula emetica]
MPTATNGQTSPVPPSLRVSEESHSSSTPAPQQDSATPSAEATPAGVTAASPMPIKPTQLHAAISIPNGDQLLHFDPVLTGCNVKKPAWLSELHTHTTLDPPLPPQNHPLYRRTTCSHKPPPTFWKFICDRPLPITPQFARLLLVRHCRSPNSDSATYRRSDRSSPRPESDDGMPYNHRRTSVKADEMAPEDTQLTSRAPNSDGTPRRPMNVSAANQTMRTGDISKILSKEWNSMDMPRYAPPPGPPPPCRPRPASTSSGAGLTAPPASDGRPNVGTNLTTLTHRQCLGQQLNKIDTDRFAFVTSTADVPARPVAHNPWVAGMGRHGYGYSYKYYK